MARLEELKRDLAQMEHGRSRARRSDRGGDRGHEADHPGEIPPKGWMDVLWRAWGEVSEQNLFLIAGGVTYAILLALFPGLASLVSLYGLVLDASQIEKQVSALSGILPAQTQQLLTDQLHQLVEASSGTLSIGAGIGIVLALWSASRGMSGLITALNIAYEEKEARVLQTETARAGGSPSLGCWVGWLSLPFWPCCPRRCSSSAWAGPRNGCC
jgi:membrane protein